MSEHAFNQPIPLLPTTVSSPLFHHPLVQGLGSIRLPRFFSGLKASFPFVPPRPLFQSFFLSPPPNRRIEPSFTFDFSSILSPYSVFCLLFSCFFCRSAAICCFSFLFFPFPRCRPIHFVFRHRVWRISDVPIFLTVFCGGRGYFSACSSLVCLSPVGCFCAIHSSVDLLFLFLAFDIFVGFFLAFFLLCRCVFLCLSLFLAVAFSRGFVRGGRFFPRTETGVDCCSFFPLCV